MRGPLTHYLYRAPLCELINVPEPSGSGTNRISRLGVCNLCTEAKILRPSILRSYRDVPPRSVDTVLVDILRLPVSQYCVR